MRDIYINSNLSPPTKFTSSSGSTEFKDILSWNISNDHKDHFNRHESSYKPSNETGHPVLSLWESQWKLKQHDQNFPMAGKLL